MISWIVLVLALLLGGLFLFWLFGSIFGRGEMVAPLPRGEELHAENLRALREDPNLDRVRFQVVLRGYKQEQVDLVLGAMEKEIQQLRSQLGQAH